MLLRNKRILFLCKESYSYPLYFIAEKWRKNNTLATYFFMPAECVYNKCFLNEKTYYKFKESVGVEVFDVLKISNIFTKHLKQPPIDFEYIRYIENNYTHFRNLNLQLMSSQLTTKYYHNRFYFSDCTYEQQMYWLELNYKNAIDIIEKFKPDVIFDLDDAELPRSIINEIAYKEGIPYITLEHPRYDFYKYPTYTMGIGIDKYFAELYHHFLNVSETSLEDEIQYVKNYREQSTIMPIEYKNTITSQYKKDKLLMMSKVLLGKIMYFFEQDISAGNYRLKKKNKILYPGALKYIRFYFQVEFRKRRLFDKNPYFIDPIEGESYVYMPLHLIPESTTFVKAPLYVNELFIIEEISKSLPIGWMLYVKEHQAMLGERSLAFYKQVNQLPNVKLVSINYYEDPKPWILNSEGVITITGTSAYEAALLGKKSLVFGDIPFSIIEGITKVNSVDQLPKLIKEFGKIENMHSCAAYIATVKEAGSEVKLKYLMSEGENILYNRKKISAEYENELAALEKFYENAYQRLLSKG